MKRVPLRHVLAVFVGNGLEFYDFVTFSYFSVYIGRTFFPSGNHDLSLLAALATFGVGFLTRPVGAVVLGAMGDRVGRKPAMLATFALMGVAITGLALTPSYAQIGPAAPVLVILFRLLQGFALGGEVGPTTAFMTEAAPPERRGFYLSLQYTTQDCATLAAGIVGVVLAANLSDAQLTSWGWRAAMLLGAAIVPFGLWVRHHLPETLETPTPPGAAARLARPHMRLFVLGIVMLVAGTVGNYTLGYMTTYALDTLKLPAATAFGITIVNGAAYIVSQTFAGWWSDLWGRKVVMIVPSVLLLVAIFPCFWLIEHVRGVWVLYGAQAVMVLLAGAGATPVIVAIAELLPAPIRSGAMATVYALAISLFGGSTQFVIKALLAWTANPFAPAWYWSACAVAGLVAMVMMPESAPVKRKYKGQAVE
ncbi:MAG TPA: MFS transporter [Rhizomicrobium sp.]|nr:MFS transporter [Rhizomicrobium sp.]